MPHERPIITLTTGFGMADGTVGAMIGVIKSVHPDAEVVNPASENPAYRLALSGLTFDGRGLLAPVAANPPRRAAGVDPSHARGMS